MKFFFRIVFTLTLFLITSIQLYSQDWRDRMENIIYAPRYFGPNGFPIPELRESVVAQRFEIEVRGEYHYYKGDKTKDFFTRVMIPVVKEKAAIEISAIVFEDYKLTPETRDERFATETESPISYNGDVIFSTFFQLLKSPKWVDIMLSLNLKTASGGRLVDARFTDAASYWFDTTVGRKVYEDPAQKVSVSVQGLAGFYCWMTNDRVHRQNDAIHYGIGFTAKLKNFTLQSDFSGFHGYENKGDKPMILRNNLRYEYKKNGLSLRYYHGMKDRLYETYTLGYIRYF
ncbi:MAG: hypothetical protein PHG27_04795 [Massilibacteroides sp.]|nr:hypothetical protein [Massilibacteroides sp.]MDD3061633.1 hypothetical protein [Massilibacteroides sp.]MDD4114904.1 hypothetical protein [Massilibacteroides sp.]MDD4659983.1 hypothetical protein [Massilibacteroides sp.]